MTTTQDTRPMIGSIKRHNGIAGQYALSVAVRYPGETPVTVTFIGSTYGGPIVMTSADYPGVQTFVSADVLDRIGRELSPAWVRRFFGLEA